MRWVRGYSMKDNLLVTLLLCTAFAHSLSALITLSLWLYLTCRCLPLDRTLPSLHL